MKEKKRTQSLDDELFRNILPIDIDDTDERFYPVSIENEIDGDDEDNENDQTHLNLIEEEKKGEEENKQPVVAPVARPMVLGTHQLKQKSVDVTVAIIRKMKPGEEV